MQFFTNRFCADEIKEPKQKSDAMETVEKEQSDSTMFVISSIPTTSGNSNSLKDLSMSEILKLAEDRAKIEGISKRLTDNPWHKRMVVSDNVTRRQALDNALTNHRQTSFDNNDEFFENLMTKMTKEQFMPYGKASRKRERLWNKENSNSTERIKRQKDIKLNKTKFIPPGMNLFEKRLLPQMKNNNNLTPGVQVQSQSMTVEKQQKDCCDQGRKSAPNSIQEDTDMIEAYFNSSETTAMDSEIDDIFRWNRTVQNNTSTCTQETLKLELNRPVTKIDHHSIREASPSHYYVEKYPRSIWNSPRLSNIEEYRQLSMIVESPVLQAIDGGYNISVHLTPPLLMESSNCEACNIDKKIYDDNANINSSRLLSPMISFDSNHEMLGIMDESLFT